MKGSVILLIIKSWNVEIGKILNKSFIFLLESFYLPETDSNSIL